VEVGSKVFWIENMEHNNDAIAVAAQLGRLDFVSALLAGIGIILIVSGIFAFINIRSIAKSRAEKVAEKVAERIANEYLQREIPDIVKANQEIVKYEFDEAADELSDAQENGEGRP